MTKSFPKLVKEMDTQVLEAQSVQSKMDPRRPMPRHIIVKMSKVKNKEKNLKALKEKK